MSDLQDSALPGVGSRAESTPDAKKQHTPKTAAQIRNRRIAIHRWVRFAIQIVFLILAPGLFSAAFNGMKSIFTSVGATQAITVGSIIYLLIALVIYTIVFGRFFCGYACAFGTLGDIVYAVWHTVAKRIGLPEPNFPIGLVRVLSFVKYILLAAILVACFLGVYSTVSGFSPWVSFGALTSLSVEGIALGSFILLALVVILMAIRERAFCQFLCPMGAIFALLPVLPFSSFRRKPADCASRCDRCQQACPVDIHPDYGSQLSGECIGCGRCADACPLGNVNTIALRKDGHAADGDVLDEKAKAGPKRKTSENYRLYKGNENASVVLKALILLAICWVLGATRYLPAFSSLLS